MECVTISREWFQALTAAIAAANEVMESLDLKAEPSAPAQTIGGDRATIRERVGNYALKWSTLRAIENREGAPQETRLPMSH